MTARGGTISPLSSRVNAAYALRLAEVASEEGREEEALPVVEAAARTTDIAALWQWTGLLYRAIDRRDLGLPALHRALRLAPRDVRIAHSVARIRLEAGLAAVDAFAAAHALSPLDGDILLGLSAAQLADGDAKAAIDGLATACADHPGWMAGHAELSQMRWMTGYRHAFVESYERALLTAPRAPELWRGLVSALFRAGYHVEALDAANRANAAMGDDPIILVLVATILSERGEVEAADAGFAALPKQGTGQLVVHRVRHALRCGRLREALREIDHGLAGPDAAALWPYAATAWRQAGDRRSGWLQSTNLIQNMPLDVALEPLVGKVRELHQRGGEMFDQSVRDGSQTIGSLLSRVEPEIRALRATIGAAVARYVSAIPPVDPRHPTLSAKRDRPVRLAGSWSVRLRGGGHHVSHVHPAGWLSAVFYMVAPEGDDGSPNAGTLHLGQPPRDFGSTEPAIERIAPQPGRLILFPSWMWHGTTPFSKGERLTIAFDIRNPR
jgi:uncharacterized protein (TIGR02466 family)